MRSTVAHRSSTRANDTCDRSGGTPFTGATASCLLGFPAYVIGLVLRVPPSKIDESFLGTLLRLATLVASVLAIYATGKKNGLW